MARALGTNADLVHRVDVRDDGVTCSWRRPGRPRRMMAAVGISTGEDGVGDLAPQVSPDKVLRTPDGRRVVYLVDQSTADPGAESVSMKLPSQDGTVTLFVEVPMWVERDGPIELELMDKLIDAVQPAD